MKYFVIQSNQSGKYADGFYGWDSSILTENQIFAENELPYKPNDKMKFLLVGDGSKPSPMIVRNMLLGLETGCYCVECLQGIEADKQDGMCDSCRIYLENGGKPREHG